MIMINYLFKYSNDSQVIWKSYYIIQKKKFYSISHDELSLFLNNLEEDKIKFRKI